MPSKRKLIKQSVSSKEEFPTLWFTGAFSVMAFALAATTCVAAGLPRSLSTAAGMAAMLASAGYGLVPPGRSRQVGLPASFAVAAALPTAWLCDVNPAVAAVVTAVFIALCSLSQADAPTGATAGTLAGTTFVLAVASRLLGVVDFTSAVEGALIATVSAAVSAVLLAWLRALALRREWAIALQPVPPLPGTLASRWSSSVAASLRDWRTDPYVRLAFRRVVVLSPLMGVLEAWGNKGALYTLLVVFGVTQVTVRDTAHRTVARVLGTVVACAAAMAFSAILPLTIVLAFGVVGMAFGLAHLRRNPFYTAVGTTLFALAMASASAPGGGLALMSGVAGTRLLAVLAGAALGLAATLLIPPPPAPAGAA